MPTPVKVQIPLADLTQRQLLIYQVGLWNRTVKTLEKVESFMSELTTSVAALQTAVDEVAVRFAGQVGPLTAALTAAQEALAAATLDDEADAQAIADALAEAQAAAASIDSDVAELNALGANPDVPVEPPVDVPQDPEAPEEPQV